MNDARTKSLAVLGCLIAATMLVSGGTASAQRDTYTAWGQEDDAIARQVRVPVVGLDLGSPADQAVLHRRLERAAREVCGLFDGGISTTIDSYRDCHAAAIAGAEAQLQRLMARAANGRERAVLAGRTVALH